jgi:hypothetical protein
LKCRRRLTMRIRKRTTGVKPPATQGLGLEGRLAAAHQQTPGAYAAEKRRLAEVANAHAEDKAWQIQEQLRKMRQQMSQQMPTKPATKPAAPNNILPPGRHDHQSAQSPHARPSYHATPAEQKPARPGLLQRIQDRRRNVTTEQTPNSGRRPPAHRRLVEWFRN